MASDRSKFRSTPEATARLLLLIDAFSRQGDSPRSVEGRVKLAKLDFFMRYPWHFARVLASRTGAGRARVRAETVVDAAPVDSRMMRYRYGPWDPSYFALLGSLIGRGLIEMIPLGTRNGFGYRTTELGEQLAGNLRADESFREIDERAKDLRRHLDMSGTSLKNLVYSLPEVSDATWREDLQ